MTDEQPAPTLGEEIDTGLGAMAIVNGINNVRPLGFSQLLSRAKVVRKEEGETGKVCVVSIDRNNGGVLTPAGVPTFSMGVFWIPAKDVFEAWRKGHEMHLLAQIRHHYGHLGNCYVVSREVADELRPEVKRLAKKIWI